MSDAHRRVTEDLLRFVDNWIENTGKNSFTQGGAAGMFMVQNAQRLVDEVRRQRALIRKLVVESDVPWWREADGSDVCVFCRGIGDHAPECPWPDIEEEATKA